MYFAPENNTITFLYKNNDYTRAVGTFKHKALGAHSRITKQ